MENINMSRILLVDDEPSILSVLSTLLKTEGYDVEPVNDGEKAKELLASDDFDLLLSDIRMTPVNGLELLKIARGKKHPLTTIMLTAYGSVETAIDALKLGAFDFVTKPFKVDELLITIQRALEFSNTLSENASLKEQLDSRYHIENIIAESSEMQDTCEMIKKVAPSDTTVLIYGESGTGKELVAKAIHSYSKRSKGNFLAVNCAALPEALLESEMFGHVKGSFTGASSNKTGLFEAANSGTIFLDEVGSIPLAVQGKLLRVLQEKEVRAVGSNKTIKVDARVLAATNVPLEQLIQEGTFREDLYYRLSVIPINIKPLRERQDDILPLVMHFIRQDTPKNSEPPSLSPETKLLLETYSWPGNIRELENAVKHAITFADNNKIEVNNLPARIATYQNNAIQTTINNINQTENYAPQPLKDFLKNQERIYIKQILVQNNNNKDKTAAILQVSLATLYRKLTE